ncbi:hypothetical protein COW36_00220 [bacterium (Candidatus Blackallbacteria) CG17_big_fil_post_rev_8_21_14_2_50_48_46]|uniref:Uncharacterized protein n=1 Tax=bacterium (Candidatus Blackallbacteria) CG17_big_fil_post_rev_8_21_14_2_50_48_46 TaxID=2014261 RepID=A0A2M7GBN3_9BACT|nr:MAG: hypothetical protein COW64_25725 [bacterium (Candidatus Blackallbacteria) CG18_big_fil_WC_8_21_14_2_50_49_26]PIW19606.1 MAG: hypothetical protein COW36_00220 [bacterium (Candidatus Blackallbacteria) CG17_big_fil_post_rev_8_21_14_2_50_48_46]
MSKIEVLMVISYFLPLFIPAVVGLGISYAKRNSSEFNRTQISDSSDFSQENKLLSAIIETIQEIPLKFISVFIWVFTVIFDTVRSLPENAQKEDFNGIAVLMGLTLILSVIYAFFCIASLNNKRQVATYLETFNVFGNPFKYSSTIFYIFFSFMIPIILRHIVFVLFGR